MTGQTAIQEIAKAVDGDLTDIQLVERIIGLQQDKKRVADALKRTISELAQRLVDKGVTEETIGEHLVVVSQKLLTDYDQTTLSSLRQCVTEDQVWLAFKQLPSSKQLKAVSEQAGAAAKSVIESARRKNETGQTVLRIRKPRKPGRNGGRRHGRRN